MVCRECAPFFAEGAAAGVRLLPASAGMIPCSGSPVSTGFLAGASTGSVYETAGSGCERTAGAPVSTTWNQYPSFALCLSDSRAS